MKQLEYAVKSVERKPKKGIENFQILIVDEMGFGFMADRETTGVLIVMRGMQEKYTNNEKNLYCTCVL